MVARRVQQSARRIHLHQQGLCAVGVGAGNGPVSSPCVTGWMVSARTNLSTSGCLRLRWLRQRPARPNPAKATKPMNCLNSAAAWLAPSGPAPRAPAFSMSQPLACTCRSSSWAAGLAGSSFRAAATLLLASLQLVGRKIEPSQHQVRIGAGPQFQRRWASMRAALGIASALAHLGQPGMRLGAVPVGQHGRLIKPLGLQQQASIEKAPCLRGELLRPLKRRKGAPTARHPSGPASAPPGGMRQRQTAHDPLQRIGSCARHPRWHRVTPKSSATGLAAGGAAGCAHAACSACRLARRRAAASGTKPVRSQPPGPAHDASG